MSNIADLVDSPGTTYSARFMGCSADPVSATNSVSVANAVQVGTIATVLMNVTILMFTVEFLFVNESSWHVGFARSDVTN